MTDFKSFMEAEAANDIAALGGETVTHTPDGASGESVSAIIDREERVRDDRPSTDADVRRATLHVASPWNDPRPADRRAVRRCEDPLYRRAQSRGAVPGRSRGLRLGARRRRRRLRRVPAHRRIPHSG